MGPVLLIYVGPHSVQSFGISRRRITKCYAGFGLWVVIVICRLWLLGYEGQDHRAKETCTIIHCIGIMVIFYDTRVQQSMDYNTSG